MRLSRAFLPAVVAAALWLASGGIELFGRQVLTGPERYVLELVAPETVPVLQLTAPEPWALVMISLGVFALAAAYATSLALIRRRHIVRDEAGLALAAYWFCAVVAASVVAALPIVVDVAEAIVEQATPLTLGTDRFLQAAHWGLIWGWAPALVAMALDKGINRAFSRRAVALASAAMLLVAAVGLTVAAPYADTAIQAAIPAEPAPEPAPTGTPVPSVAEGEWQIDPQWCTSGQLQFTAGVVDAALGNRALTVRATNISDAACVLESYPDIAFSDQVTSALNVQIDHGGTMLTDDPGVTRLELQPGAAAVAGIGWGAMPTAGLAPAGWLHIAAFHGAERQMLQIDTDITGGTVSVTAWGNPAP